MSNRPALLGRVVVIAGELPRLADIASAVVASGAQVAVVSASLDPATPATVRFRANPRDRDAWDRIAMHVEQHLGPVDGVATDAATLAVVDTVFSHDLRRRGHGCVVAVDSDRDIDDAVTALCGTPPATTSPRPDEQLDR